MNARSPLNAASNSFAQSASGCANSVRQAGRNKTAPPKIARYFFARPMLFRLADRSDSPDSLSSETLRARNVRSLAPASKTDLHEHSSTFGSSSTNSTCPEPLPRYFTAKGPSTKLLRLEQMAYHRAASAKPSIDAAKRSVLTRFRRRSHHRLGSRHTGFVFGHGLALRCVAFAHWGGFRVLRRHLFRMASCTRRRPISDLGLVSIAGPKPTAFRRSALSRPHLCTQVAIRTRGEQAGQAEPPGDPLVPPY